MPTEQDFMQHAHLKKIIYFLLILGGLIVFISSILGCWGTTWWFFDLFSNYKVQYFISLLLIFLLLFIFYKKIIWPIIFSLMIAINFQGISSYFISKSKKINDNGHFLRNIRLMQLNVNVANNNYNQIIGYIRNKNPDIVVMEEITLYWEKYLNPLKKQYPYIISKIKKNIDGAIILSKWPIKKSDKFFYKTFIPILSIELNINGQNLFILATHNLSPANKRRSLMRNNTFNFYANILSNYPRNKLLVGDLNITPWSTHFKDFIKKSKLIDSSISFGVQSTWPSYFWPLKIPIDHVLHDQNIKIISKKIGPDLGSDHFPVLVDFTFHR